MGQLDVWLKMRRLGRTFAMGGARAMPAGATVEDVAGAVVMMAETAARHSTTGIVRHPERRRAPQRATS